AGGVEHAGIDWPRGCWPRRHDLPGKPDRLSRTERRRAPDQPSRLPPPDHPGLAQEEQVVSPQGLPRGGTPGASGSLIDGWARYLRSDPRQAVAPVGLRPAVDKAPSPPDLRMPREPFPARRDLS